MNQNREQAIMNTKIEYLYRDAENYKLWDEVIVEGHLTIEQLEPFYHEGEFFIPSVVGLNDLQSEPLTVNDHIWHTIELVETTDKSPTSNISAEKLLSNFADAAKNDWFQALVFKRKGLM